MQHELTAFFNASKIAVGHIFLSSRRDFFYSEEFCGLSKFIFFVRDFIFRRQLAYPRDRPDRMLLHADGERNVGDERFFFAANLRRFLVRQAYIFLLGIDFGLQNFRRE